jgi:hypothetical protein
MQSQAGTNKVVEIRGKSTASGARAQIATENGSAAQSFEFVNCDESGRCQIQNVRSDKCLGVAGAATARGSLVRQYTCNDSDSQRWLPVEAGNGLHRIQSAVAANRWLEVRDPGAGSGSPLRIWSQTLAKAQLFRLGPAPDWGISYAQVGQGTQVTATIAADSLAAWATKVTVTARLSYRSTVTRQVRFTQELAGLNGDSFTFDVGDYGKWSVTAAFYKGSTKVRTRPAASVVVDADQYVIAPLTGTMPVTMFSTSLWGPNPVQGATDPAPVIVQLQRAKQWDWDKLPAGVHANPYATRAQYTTVRYLNRASELAPMKAYIKDLRALNSDSVFHLYVNDYHLQMVQALLYANRIPQDRYTITLLSDGTFSYARFSTVYGGATPENEHQKLVASWTRARDYAYRYGELKPGMTAGVARDCLYAAVDSEPSAQWWLTRPALLSSPGDQNAFGTKAAANTAKVKTVSLNGNLTAIKNAGPEVVAQFKDLFKFNDAYFAKSVANGKKVMMFLGTDNTKEDDPATSQDDFAEYARFTMKYYGSAYDYYYKGHPRTPTGLSPTKQAQLARLGITDVDSSVPAELILFFNPNIYMSGYDSTTYLSVSDPDMAKGLFRITKANADPTKFKDIAWFMTPKAVHPDAVKALPGDFVIEFADKIATVKGYDLALWDADAATITYYKLVEGVYTKVLPR